MYLRCGTAIVRPAAVVQNQSEPAGVGEPDELEPTPMAADGKSRWIGHAVVIVIPKDRKSLGSWRIAITYRRIWDAGTRPRRIP